MSQRSTSELTAAVDHALDWLTADQRPSGELASWASPLDTAEPSWLPDQLNFVTALGAVALDEVDDPRARSVVDRAVRFLAGERSTCAQWRYWAQSNDQYDFTPPDADDTACCSLAVQTRGHRSRANIAVLMGNRDRQGRFHTWIVPRGRTADPRRLWALRDEYRSIVRHRRDELWRTTEARPGDVDAVVNTNVLRYLGPRRAPVEAVDWIVSIIDDGCEDDSDAWHRNPLTLYAAIADARRRGFVTFDRVSTLICDRVHHAVADHDRSTPLDLALALIALQGLDGDQDQRAELVDRLLAAQHDDGSWSRSVFFYGGPLELFGWASEALTASYALQALERERTTVLSARVP